MEGLRHGFAKWADASERAASLAHGAGDGEDRRAPLPPAPANTDVRMIDSVLPLALSTDLTKFDAKRCAPIVSVLRVCLPPPLLLPFYLDALGHVCRSTSRRDP
jgi:hypothetical protein